MAGNAAAWDVQNVNRFVRSLRTRPGAAYALMFGLLTHITFAIAVGVIVVGLYSGLSTGRGTFQSWTAALFNTLLIVQFPVAHSFLLRKRGRALLARLAPYGIGRDLAPTTFTLIASLQLLATFMLWSPSEVVVRGSSGVEFRVFQFLFAASWIFLLKALFDSGLAVQTGYIGWSSVVKGKKPEYGGFPKRRLFRFIRHPVYLGLAFVLWTAPVKTLDGVVLASVWTVYCLAGPLFKEQRFRRWYGEQYARYRAAVPYMVPRIRRNTDKPGCYLRTDSNE